MGSTSSSCTYGNVIKALEQELLRYFPKDYFNYIHVSSQLVFREEAHQAFFTDAELKKRISNAEAFSVLYLDLDNFKAYNDVYGFLKGDQIIEFTSRVIIKCIHELMLEHCFVGHIGGDDFVAIVPLTNVEKLCQTIIAIFDKQVTQFFTDDDIEKGYIEVANRRGIIEQFPLTSISIGVVVADTGRFHNILEIGEVGAQVKHAAKSVMGSSYAVDRRK